MSTGLPSQPRPAREPESILPGFKPARSSGAVHRPRHGRFYTWFASTVRWLHIYVSLVGFTALLFFAVTGITLNHPSWLGGEVQRVSEFDGMVSTDWLHLKVQPVPDAGSDSANEAVVDYGLQIDKLAVTEHLRNKHGVRGAVKEFRVDEYECLILFRGPAYAVDVTLDRESGKYSGTQTAMGLVALMNDLHKGRDTGAEWSLVIDLSAILMIVVSLTGFVLIFYLKRKRRSGLISALIGTVLFVAAWYIWVP